MYFIHRPRQAYNETASTLQNWISLRRIIQIHYMGVSDKLNALSDLQASEIFITIIRNILRLHFENVL